MGIVHIIVEFRVIARTCARVLCIAERVWQTEFAAGGLAMVDNSVCKEGEGL